MNDDRIFTERAEMERRVVQFRQTQARFQRERDDYYAATIAKVRATDWNVYAQSRAERSRATWSRPSRPAMTAGLTDAGIAAARRN